MDKIQTYAGRPQSKIVQELIDDMSADKEQMLECCDQDTIEECISYVNMLKGANKFLKTENQQRKAELEESLADWRDLKNVQEGQLAEARQELAEARQELEELEPLKGVLDRAVELQDEVNAMKELMFTHGIWHFHVGDEGGLDNGFQIVN